MKPLKNGIRLTVNGLGVPPPFLNERLPIFKEVFPRHKHLKILGAAAGANIVEESDIYAMKRGLYVLAQSGENITMLNADTFKAKVF